MLTRLSIRNIVLIEALDLDFGRGLGVLTGETGAGKSILLDALGLVLGDRAETSLVRSGEDKASVTASFEFAQLPRAIIDVLDDADLEVEPGEPLMIRRQVKADGGSKAFVNDQSVGVALLRSLAPSLVELHGQHDDRGLVNPAGHRQLVDQYASAKTGAVADAWEAWREALAKLEEARASIVQAKEDEELLIAHLAELEKLQPTVGEEVQLAGMRSDMQKGERLQGELEGIRKVWDGSNSPLASLRAAARKMERIADEHPLLAEALEYLDRAVVEAGEAEDKITEAGYQLMHDPAALEDAETRLFDLRAAARKHRCDVDALPELMVTMRAQLDAIESGEAGIGALTKAAEAAGEAYRVKAQALHDARSKAAAKLDKAVAAELAPLKLDAAKFQTRVEALPEDRWGPGGMDAVEFLISTNPGAPFAPLGKIASGGELSRFILALKVALAEQGGAATVIFDEIDRGVGGAVASAIGDRLARLAAPSDKGDGQLLAVTHSPQVAARGGTHYLIAKSSAGTVTKTSVVRLDTGERQEEIARMLSGAQVTPEARAQADRLLEGV
jgi:DNA repair protein RecN (Recombination protein N)